MTQRDRDRDRDKDRDRQADRQGQRQNRDRQTNRQTGRDRDIVLIALTPITNRCQNTNVGGGIHY